jgi:two-component system, NarL family, sensor histidine kinase DesK
MRPFRSRSRATGPGPEVWLRTPRTRRLRLAVRAAVALAGLGLVILSYLDSEPDPRAAVVVVIAAVVGTGLAIRLALLPGDLAPGLIPTRRWWVLFGVLVTITLALEAVGGPEWIALASVAGAAAGAGGGRTIGLSPVFMLATGVGVAVALNGDSSWNAAVQAGIVAVAGLFGAQAWQRAAMLDELRDTRERLVEVAASTERNRIGRDLHDLLGRTLTTATVKLELAQRLLAVDVDRARTEIVETQAVIQDSLDGVRQAVAGHRQPSLAEELDSAPDLLRTCGIDCDVSTPGGWHLPTAVDSVLAWVVREAVTNVARHSGARHCAVAFRLPTGAACLEVTDDGRGPDDDEPDRSSSGLRGVAGRLAEVGGRLSTGPAGAHGFRLRAEIPIPMVPGAAAAREGADR